MIVLNSCHTFLADGHKFDLRLYVVVTSLDPLLIYLYGDGLVRFATKPYSTDPDSLEEKFVHLTNYEANISYQQTHLVQCPRLAASNFGG